MSEILTKAVQQAIDYGQVMDFYTGNEHYSGRPMEQDGEFVQLLCVGEQQHVVTGLWNVRISAITAFSIFGETWDDDRLNRVINPDSIPMPQTTSAPVDRDDEPPLLGVVG